MLLINELILLIKILLLINIESEYLRHILNSYDYGLVFYLDKNTKECWDFEPVKGTPYLFYVQKGTFLPFCQ